MILGLFLYLPVVWAALLLAQCWDGSLLELLGKLTIAMQRPTHIAWTERSPPVLLVCTGLYAVFANAMLTLMLFVVPAFAADDPLTVVSNLSDFIFSLIRAIGLILLGFGILQIGLALKSHDASQRGGGIWSTINPRLWQ